ncbi:hypothetical protein CLOM_g2307 [Closterium sp. NIES-68]|nr:hypothetical protein CLOM_g2307 [Closterium sp. NIES-68]
MANPFAPAAASPFGAAQPASPFGATSAFGASATPASPFGQAGTSLFGGGAATGGSVFGAASAPAFGATSAPAFGAAATTPAFGSTASPFGGGSSLFGQQQKPAAFGTFGATQASPFGAPSFGQQSQPAFGAGGAFGATTTTPAFGATAATPAFGAAAPAFGASAPAFGATAATPAFGAASAPAFGATGGLFGSTGASAFGAASAPAFGSLASPSFGASAPAFGATTFGATPFGAAGAAAGMGSRNPAYTPTNDTETGTTGQPGKFISISAMPAYKNKSPEELRWEDYQRGDKGGPAPAQAGGGLFGQPAAGAASPFGAAATPTFGSPGLTGASPTNPFGQASTPSLFGSPAPSFGAAPAATPAFGASTSPSLFGSSTPAFGAAASPSAFGTPGGSLFGAAGTTAASPFGAAAASTPSLFGSPAAATASPFGASTGASLFGGASPLGQAGAAGQPGTSLFGASSPAFGAGAFGTPGAAAATPAFGATPSLFGSGATTGGGLFGSSTPAAGSTGLGFGFGTAGAAGSAPGFGAAGGRCLAGRQGWQGRLGRGCLGRLLGQRLGSEGRSRPSRLDSPSLRPSRRSEGWERQQRPRALEHRSLPSEEGSLAPRLSWAPLPLAPRAPSMGGLFGQSQPQQQQQQLQLQQQQQQQQLLQQLQQSGLLQSPFGVLPAQPNFGLGAAGGVRTSTELGISSMPASDRYASGTRVSSILTPRRITPRTRARMHPTRHFHPTRDTARVPFFFSPADHDDLSAAVPRADALFVPRDNPRALFIRTPVAPAPAPAPAPAAAAGAGAADGSPNGPGAAGSPQGSDYQSPPAGASPRDAYYAPSAPPYDSSDLPANAGQSPKSPSAARAAGTGGGFGSAMPSPTLSPAWNGSFSPSSPPPPTRTTANGSDLESHLPKLKSPDYFTEPSLSALAALERSLPGSLARVRDFVVGRKGFGSVRFLGETDVRGLDVEAIVQFHKCEILVYMDEERKPPVGEELNKPAEVTLLQVVCVDKRTGKAVTEGAELDRFERKLRRKTAEQEAEFLSFNAAKGEWRFKVNHFSRYGLEDSDDEEEEEEERGREGREEGREVGREGEEEDYETDEGMSGDDDDDDGDVDGVGDTGRRKSQWGGQSGAAGPPGGVSLDRALPAQLGIDPIRLQQMRQVMFVGDDDDNDGGDGDYGAGYAGGFGSSGFGVEAMESDWQAWGTKKAPRFGMLGAAAAAAAAAAAGATSAAGAATRNAGDPLANPWAAGFRANRRARGLGSQKVSSFRAVSRGGVRVFPEFEAGSAGAAAGAGAGGAAGGGAGAVLALGLQGRVPAHVHPGAVVASGFEWTIPKATATAAAGALATAAAEVAQTVAAVAVVATVPGEGSSGVAVDAGLFLGRSFRVGWGPAGLLVTPGKVLPAGSFASARTHAAGAAAGAAAARGAVGLPGGAAAAAVGVTPISSKITVTQVAFSPWSSVPPPPPSSAFSPLLSPGVAGRDAEAAAAAAERGAAERERLQQLLLIQPLLLHFQSSSVGGETGGREEGREEGREWVGRRLVCSRRGGGLASLCRRYSALAEAAADAVASARAASRQGQGTSGQAVSGQVLSGQGISERQLQHEQAVWQLVDVLFSDWQGKRRSAVMEGSAGVGSGEGDVSGEKSGDGLRDGSMEEERDGEGREGEGEGAALNRRLFEDDALEEEEDAQGGAGSAATARAAAAAAEQPQWLEGAENRDEGEEEAQEEQLEDKNEEEEKEGEEEEEGEEEAGEEKELYDEETMGFFRRAEFSAWLQAVVAPAIVHELNALAANPNSTFNPLTTTSAAATAATAAASLPLRVAFICLTGLQLEPAVGAAALAGDVRLASLLSLAHSAPAATRADAARQLALWDRLAGGTGAGKQGGGGVGGRGGGRGAGCEGGGGVDGDGVLPEECGSLLKLAEGSLVSVERLRLLRLVAGDVVGALEGRPLDWKRHLGLLMWFGMPSASSLGLVIAEFRKRVRGGRVPRAIPWYAETIGVEGGERVEGGGRGERVERGGSGEWEERALRGGGRGGGQGKGEEGEGGGGGVEDVMYGLLALHMKEEMGEGKLESAGDGDGGGGSGDDVAVDVAAMLRWRSWTRDALDCHLAWHLQSVLQAIGALRANEVLPSVHMDYVAQLLAAGQPHWALYCLQHVPPSRQLPRRSLECAFREVLALFCPVWVESDEQRSFIEGQLRVPASWLCAAKAAYHRYNGSRSDELQCLLGSFQWDRAHCLFMNHLAAAWILSERWSEVQQLMEGLETHGENIHGWKEGGRLLLDYVHLSAALEGQAIVPTEELVVSVADGSEALAEFSHRTVQSLRTFPLDAARLRMVYARMLDSLSRSFLTHTAAITPAAVAAAGAATTPAASAAPVDAALATTALPALPRDSRLAFAREAASELASWLAEVAPVQ